MPKAKTQCFMQSNFYYTDLKTEIWITFIHGQGKKGLNILLGK